MLIVIYLLMDLMGKNGFMEQENEYIKFMKVVAAARETYEAAAECLNVNYYGMKRVTETLIPLLLPAQSPRIVNLSSHFGLLSV